MGEPSNEGRPTSADVEQMPRGFMSAATSGGEMPPGQMRADDQPGFSPVSGDMPRGDMTAFGGLAQMQAGATGAAVLMEMPAGDMGAQAGATAGAGIEMTGTFRLELSPGGLGRA